MPVIDPVRESIDRMADVLRECGADVRLEYRGDFIRVFVSPDEMWASSGSDWMLAYDVKLYLDGIYAGLVLARAMA